MTGDVPGSPGDVLTLIGRGPATTRPDPDDHNLAPGTSNGIAAC
ncbi:MULTISPECIES: hypothetical protein [unclassified Nonomuraea]